MPLVTPAKTTVILVTRPDHGAIAEAARRWSCASWKASNQRLAVNGVFHASDRSDAVACAIEALGQQALDGMPAPLRELPQDVVLLRPSIPSACRRYAPCSHRALRRRTCTAQRQKEAAPLPDLAALADELAAAGHGLIMVMGRGGVARPPLPPRWPWAWFSAGHAVHLRHHRPGGPLAGTLEGELPGLTLSRIDPKVENPALHRQDHGGRGPKLDAQEQALLLEDLQSPAPKRWRCSTPSHAS